MHITTQHLIFMCATIFAAKTQSFSKDPIDLTYLSKYDTDSRNYTLMCVAGSNVDTALTFITPLSSQNNRDHHLVSQYFVNDGSALGTRFNCDFDPYSPCTRSWSSKEYNIIINGEFNVTPVIDARWEKFETFYTNGLHDMVKKDSSEETKNIQLSIRTSGDAHILLCDHDIGKSESKCYWIIIDAINDTNYKHILRYCEAVTKDRIKSPADSICINAVTSAKENILSESEWRHFTIIKDNEMISLTESTNGHIFRANKNDLVIKFIFMSSGKVAAWKFHKFRYLSLKNEHTKFLQIGPTYTAENNKPFCVTFYTALCNKCIISFVLQTKEGIQNESPSKSSEHYPSESKWHKFKISNEVKKGQTYGLYVANYILQNNEKGYWLIRDVRECHINETRKISLSNINTADLNDISCQALNSAHWTVRQNTNYKSPDIETHFCNKTEYIGAQCDISCNAVFDRSLSHSDHCNEHLICKYTTAKHLICACASGYIGDKCTEGCNTGMYGYNCMHKCGHCENDGKCGKSSGTCVGRCETGFDDDKPYCQTLQYPRLQQPPSLIYSTLSEIKIKFASSTTIGKKKAEKCQIQYKTPNSKNWEYYGDPLYVSANEVTFKNLKSLTEYTIRVVLYTKSGKYYDGPDVPELKVVTECRNVALDLGFIRNITAEVNSTSITICWIPVCEKTIGIQVICEQKLNNWCTNLDRAIPVKSTSKSQIIAQLIPFTKYRIQIKYAESNKIVSDFVLATDPNVPPKVEGLTVYSKSGSYISVRWRAPYPPHGNLEKYQLSYKQNGEIAKSIAIQAEPCNLWNGYLCYKFTNLVVDKFYLISIRSKNWNVSGLSTVATSNATTKEEKSHAPTNFTTIWDDRDILILNWEHPNVTNGDLVAFNIIFAQLSTSLKDHSFTTHTIKFKVDEPNKTYQYKVSELLPFSSAYEVAIRGINGEIGEAATTRIKTPPATPKLAGNVSTNEITNTTRTITIPAVELSTASDTSYMILAICDTQGDQNTNNMKDILFHNISASVNCCCAMRIAASFEVITTNEVTFKIGSNDNSKKSSKIQMPINNERLKSTENVYLVLFNEYNDQRRYTVYTIIDIPITMNKHSNSTQYVLYPLLAILLFLVPIIIWFVYRHMQKKNRLSESNDIRMSNISIHSLSSRFKLRPHNKNTEDESAMKSLIKNTSKSGDKIQSNVIQLYHLAAYVKKSIDDGELERQHASFSKGQSKSWDYGTKMENKFKNRYNNIAAYDETRVILKKVSGDQFSDYINANYIDGYRKKNAYIATQGPKLTTINDFWRMIWQEKIEYIVMLANITEGSKKKCEQYWPDLNETRECMAMEIKFLYSEIYADYEYRTFQIKNENQTRKIQQLHFTSWPDHGVPVYPQALVPFLRKILQISVERAPIVVHCSAGVGRTGTIILCDICLRMAAKERAVDVLQYFQKMRAHRANMVDNYEQYKLVHIVLLECLLAPDTNIPCDRNFEAYVQQIIIGGSLETQMSYLIDTAWHYQVMKTKKLEDSNDNQHKNRFSHIVPEYKRLYLNRYPSNDEHSDYINAIPVDGFRMKDQFIVTQTPLPNTVSDFWRMVDQFDVQVVVSLNEIILNDKTSCVFWPVENGKIIITPYLKIKFHSSKVNEFFDLYNIEMKNTSEGDGRVSIINLVQYKNWKPEMCTPKNIETFVRLLEEVQNLSRQRKPTVVTCFDGCKASGLFVALSFAIEKVKLEQKCDVCLAVRVIRQNRPEFIEDKKQFEFLYKAVVNYIESFETYSNFDLPNKN